MPHLECKTQKSERDGFYSWLPINFRESMKYSRRSLKIIISILIELFSYNLYLIFCLTVYCDISMRLVALVESYFYNLRGVEARFMGSRNDLFNRLIGRILII